MANTLEIVLKAKDRLSKAAGKSFDKVQRAADKVRRVISRVDGPDRGQGFVRMARRVAQVNRLLNDQAFRLRVIQRAERRLGEIEQRRSKLRGKLVETGVQAVAAGAPIVSAAKTQDTEIRLRTVLNTPDIERGLSLARRSAIDLAKTGLTRIREALEIQYQLNSAGLTADVARAADDIVAKTAKVTAGMPSEVAKVIATSYNNLADTLPGTAQDKLNRISELLTKVQFKFQIDDFAQIGQSLTEGASGIAAAKVPLGQALTVLGQLNSAGLGGSRAGTALRAVLRSLTKAGEEFGFQIVRSADGQLDMLSTLENLKQSLASFDNLDDRNAALQQAFGDEGLQGVVPLLGKLDELRASLKDVEEGSKGIVDSNAKLFTDNTVGRWNRTVSTLEVLADVFGRVLLPGVNAVLGPVASLLSFMADLAERFPRVTATIGGILTALIALRAAFILGKLASLAFSTASIFGFKAMAIAFAASPVGLILTGIALAAGLIVANWESVQAFFVGIWEPVKSAWTRFLNFVQPLIDRILRPIKAVAGFFGFGSVGAAGAPGSDGGSATGPVKARPPASVLASQAGAGGGTQVTKQTEIKVYQQPGEDGEALADRIARKLREQDAGLLADTVE